MMHSRWINGNLAYWDTHQCRIIDAWGANVYKYLNHFVGLPVDDTTANPTEWSFSGDTATGSLTSPASLTGGVINIAQEPHGYERARAYDRIRTIHDTVLRVFQRAEDAGVTTAAAADRLAEERITSVSRTRLIRTGADRERG